MKQKSPNDADRAPETFDALRQRIRDRFTGLSPHLQRIARASLEEPNGFALNTTPVIAASLEIQPSTLIRFAKEFGYSGFSDLQRVFRQRLIEGEATVRDRVLARDETAPPPDARAMLETCIAAHRGALDLLHEKCDIETLNRTIQILRNARHIYIAGLRRAHPIAEYFHYGLIRGERAASLLDFSGGMAGPQIATFGPEDVMFAVSFPPYSKPVLDVVMDAHVSGRRICAVTDSAESPLARYSEVALLIDTGANSRLQPISGAIALVQTLVTAITQP